MYISQNKTRKSSNFAKFTEAEYLQTIHIKNRKSQANLIIEKSLHSRRSQKKKSITDGNLIVQRNSRKQSRSFSIKLVDQIDLLSNEKFLKKKISIASQQGLLKRQSQVIQLQQYIKSKYELLSVKICCKKKRTKIQSIPQSEINLTEKSLTEQINDAILDLKEDEITEKAIRHFKDAYYQRQYRNDIDGNQNKFKRELWLFLNSLIWKSIIILNSLVYQLLVFSEPVNQYVQLDYSNFQNTVMIETICLFIITLETSLSLLFILKIKDEVLLKNPVFLSKCILNILMISDFLYYTVSYPTPIYRFSRFLRPALLICYSQKVSNKVILVLHSLQHLSFLFVLQMIVILIFAFIGSNLMADLKDSQKTDQFTNDYGDFFKASFILFVLGNKEYIPDLLIAPMNYSRYYLCLYIPFILLFVIFLVPVPQAMVFECYHQHIKKLQLKQEQNVKEALAVSFFCIDIEDNGFIQFDQAVNFFKILFKINLNPDFVKTISLLTNKDNQISMDEFLQIFLIIKKYPKFSLDRLPSLKVWDQLYFYINKTFKLKEKIESLNFTLFMFFVTLTNCILIITTLSLKDSPTLYDLNYIDQIFFIIYAVEAFTKILALGIYDYLEDRWNVFDFVLLIIQVFSDFILVDIIQPDIGQTIQANRVLKLARIQRIPRLFKAFRLVKVAKIFLYGLDVFQKAESLLFKIILTAPILLDFLTLVWAVFYSYVLISVEILAYPKDVSSPYEGINCDKTYQNKIQDKYIIWSNCEFSDFSTIDNAFLVFFQMYVSRWADVVNDYAHKTGDFTKVALFIGSFIISMAFLQAIMNGLVWDVFNQEFQDATSQESLQAGLEEFQQSNNSLNNAEKINYEVNEDNIIHECNIEVENNSQYDSHQTPQKSIDYIKADPSTNKFKKLIKSDQFQKEIIKIEFSDQDDYSFIYEQINPTDQTQIFLIAQSKIEQKQFINNQKLKQLKYSDASPSQIQYTVNSLQDIKFNLQDNSIENFIQEEFVDLFHTKYLNFRDRVMFGQKRRSDHTIAQSLAFFYGNETPPTIGNNLKNILKNQISQFGYLNVNEVHITELIQQSKQLTQHLSYLLKYNIEPKQFLNILIESDKMINNNLLNEKSFMKTVFQNTNGKWFAFDGKEKIKYISLDTGPWDFFSQILSESLIIAEQNIFFYEIKNDFNLGDTSEYEIQIKQCLRNLSLKFKHQTIGNDTFHTLEQLQNQLKNCRPLYRNQNEDACILISKYPCDTAQNTQTKQLMQIWFLRYDKIKNSAFKISYIKTMKKHSDNQQNILLNFLENSNNQKQQEELTSPQKNIQSQNNRLNFEETIELAADIWRGFRGREQFIKQQIDQIRIEREKIQALQNKLQSSKQIKK